MRAETSRLLAVACHEEEVNKYPVSLEAIYGQHDDQAAVVDFLDHMAVESLKEMFVFQRWAFEFLLDFWLYMNPMMCHYF